MGYNTGMIERIICYGDSNTYGYDPRSYLGGRYGEDERWVDLLARGLGVECANRGENGLRIPRRALPPLAAGERMIVMLGANDLLCGESAGECAHRLDALLEMSGVEPFAALIVAPPPSRQGAGSTLQTRPRGAWSRPLTACTSPPPGTAPSPAASSRA